MSELLTFYSKANDLAVIDLAFNIFQFNQKYRRTKLSFDENIMLDSLWVEKLKGELLALQRNYPNAFIGISMEFIHSCKDSGAFLHFTTGISDTSKIFFYNILPGCDFQARMISDLASSGTSPHFDNDSGVLFLAKQEEADAQCLVERCKKVILTQIEDIVRGIVIDKKPLELLASSNVYVDHYVDIKHLFMNSDELLLIVYYMSRRLLAIDMEYDALIATSKNGAVLAGLLGRMTGKKVVYCVNVGPQYSLSAYAVEQIQPKKRYVYVYDFICLGTEAKLLYALLTSRRASLAGGIGVASYVPLANPELGDKHSPLADIDCLVDLISAGIPYNVYIQRDTVGPQVISKLTPYALNNRRV